MRDEGQGVQGQAFQPQAWSPAFHEPDMGLGAGDAREEERYCLFRTELGLPKFLY